MQRKAEPLNEGDSTAQRSADYLPSGERRDAARQTGRGNSGSMRPICLGRQANRNRNRFRKGEVHCRTGIQGKTHSRRCATESACTLHSASDSRAEIRAAVTGTIRFRKPIMKREVPVSSPPSPASYWRVATIKVDVRRPATATKGQPSAVRVLSEGTTGLPSALIKFTALAAPPPRHDKSRMPHLAHRQPRPR